MTLAKLKKLSLKQLRHLAEQYNLPEVSDFEKSDYVHMLEELLGEDRVAWKLMDQYLD